MKAKDESDSSSNTYVEDHPEPYRFTVHVVAIDGAGNETPSTTPYVFMEAKETVTPAIVNGTPQRSEGNADINVDEDGCSYSSRTHERTGFPFLLALGGLAMLKRRERRFHFPRSS